MYLHYKLIYLLKKHEKSGTLGGFFEGCSYIFLILPFFIILDEEKEEIIKKLGNEGEKLIFYIKFLLRIYWLIFIFILIYSAIQ